MPVNRGIIWSNSYKAKSSEVTNVPVSMVMVDSGNQVFAGTAEYETFYRDMINTSAKRAPQAEIHATYEQSGQSIHFTVEVQNLTGQTLASATNVAFIHAFVYLTKPSGVISSNVFAVVSTPIQSLEPNQVGTFTLETPALNVTNWNNLHYLVLVDYVPTGLQGAHDMLQAAEAVKE